jgi:hypothetical protein
MTMSAPSTIEIICPCCQARLTVDPARKVVLHHETPAKTTPSMNLQDAIGSLKTEATRREAQFQQALARRKGRERSSRKSLRSS